MSEKEYDDLGPDPEKESSEDLSPEDDEGTSDDVPQSDTGEASTGEDGSQSDSGDVNEETYSQRVQKRIDKLVARAKSAEERAVAAETRARAVADEIERIRASVREIQDYNQEARSRTVQEDLNAQLADARQRYKDARNLDDIDTELAIQDEILTLREKITKAKSAPPQPDKRKADHEPAPASSYPKATQDWLANNPWYMSGTHPALSYQAMAIVSELSKDNKTSSDPETYKELNRRLREEVGAKYADLIKDADSWAETPKRTSRPPVGGGSVAIGDEKSPNKRRLTAEDLDMMDKFGMDRNDPVARRAWLTRNDPI